MNKENLFLRRAIFAFGLLLIMGWLTLTGKWQALGLGNLGPSQVERHLAATGSFPAAPELTSGTWINSDPLTIQGLRGRVVLVEFWTFGCYNCRNTLPYVKKWNEKFADKGLTVVGVHSPESELEQNVETLREQVGSLGIRFPVVTDNNYAIWKAYKVNAWPTFFLIDKQGQIRWTHVGEGAYAEAENLIQKLISENENQGVNMTETINKTEAEWRKELTPEQYHVLREAGTERAFTGAYWDTHEPGVYYCAACGLELFKSDTKFDSGTGWPSFYQPVSKESVLEDTDNTLGMARTEVKCHRCGSHLGHVFNDGPDPTGLRYCMNSTSLKFVKK
jgi:peptide-methionine (R)-S-oxide reductase